MAWTQNKAGAEFRVMLDALPWVVTGEKAPRSVPRTEARGIPNHGASQMAY